MIKLILIILGAVFLIWFLLPFFTYRILNIGNLTGIGVGLVLLLYGLFFRPVNRFIARFWQIGVGKVIEIVVGLCILAILVLAVMCMVCMGRGMSAGFQQAPGVAEADGKQSDETADVQKQVHGSDAIYQSQYDPRTVIVLGCKTIGDRPSLMLTERLQAAYEYLSTHPEATAIVSGGLGEDETVAEAEVMYHWLIEKGISPDRILKEDQSTDTHENLANCYEIILQRKTSSEPGKNKFDDTETVYPDQEEASVTTQEKIEYTWSSNVLLATNEFHEYRSLKIARKTGFTAEPLPARTAWWLFPTYYVREMYGILEDWFLTQ